MNLARFWPLMCASFVAGCSSGVPVTIANRSGTTLENVVISGSGFSVDIGTMQPDTTRRVTVTARGETGLAISFVALGKKIAIGPRGYFEASGYCASATVDSTLDLAVGSNLQPCL
jgi:hypothetical protein